MGGTRKVQFNDTFNDATAVGRPLRHKQWDLPGVGAPASVVYYDNDEANVVAEYDGLVGDPGVMN